MGIDRYNRPLLDGSDTGFELEEHHWLSLAGRVPAVPVLWALAHGLGGVEVVAGYRGDCGQQVAAAKRHSAGDKPGEGGKI